MTHDRLCWPVTSSPKLAAIYCLTLSKALWTTAGAPAAMSSKSPCNRIPLRNPPVFMRLLHLYRDALRVLIKAGDLPRKMDHLQSSLSLSLIPQDTRAVYQIVFLQGAFKMHPLRTLHRWALAIMSCVCCSVKPSAHHCHVLPRGQPMPHHIGLSHQHPKILRCLMRHRWIRTGWADVLTMMSCVCCSESPSFTGLAASMLPFSPILMYTSPAAPAACASPVMFQDKSHLRAAMSHATLARTEAAYSATDLQRTGMSKLRTQQDGLGRINGVICS